MQGLAPELVAAELAAVDVHSAAWLKLSSGTPLRVLALGQNLTRNLMSLNRLLLLSSALGHLIEVIVGEIQQSEHNTPKEQTERKKLEEPAWYEKVRRENVMTRLSGDFKKI